MESIIGKRGFVKTKQSVISTGKSILDTYNYMIDKNVTMMDFIKIFEDEGMCLELLFLLRFYSNNCHKCGCDMINNYSRTKGKRSYQCSRCGNQVYPTSGTIMQKTTTPIDIWFYTLYHICWNNKNTSAIQIKKDITQCYTTAHRMLKLRRFALYQSDTQNKMKGTIEVDEAFLGKSKSFYKWGTVISTRKKPILGFYERETGKVRVVMIDKRDIDTLDDVFLANIEVGSTVYTDGWSGYANLGKYFKHEWVNHSMREYVRGDVTTNRIEGFWGLLKKNIGHAHASVSGEYVKNYIDEIVWKFNNRHLTSMQRFDDLLNRILNN